METSNGFIDHECLKEGEIEAREYQMKLINSAVEKSTLVVLPTGTGKTPIAVVVAAERLSNHPDKSILMVAPTKPLVNQHVNFFQDSLKMSDDRVVEFTGDTPPAERSEVWNRKDTSVVISTPQCLKNDIVGNRIELSDVSHLIVDECHRTSGDYPYSFIASRYNDEAKHNLVTGLSASPGSNKEEILSVCRQLGLKNAKIMTEDDEELSQYLPETEIEEKRVTLPDDIIDMRDVLEDLFQERLKTCKELGVIDTYARSTGNRKLQSAKGNARELIKKDDSNGYKAMSLLTEAQHLNTAIRTLESRGVESLLDFFERRENDDSKASERMMENENVKDVIRRARDHDTVNRKMLDMYTIVRNEVSGGGQAIVFADSRDTVQYIEDFLEDNDIDAHRFVGQNNREGSKGMSQKEQKTVLNEFRDGEHSVLVATSVAEEGLDIPSVSLVLFFEPVSSPIRAIQRRGRTGRRTPGKVIVLLAEDTSDIGRWYAAKSKEENMKSDMNDLKNIADLEEEINEVIGEESQTETDSTLDEFIEDSEGEDNVDFSEDAFKIVADNRELQSGVVPSLSEEDEVEVNLESLDVGDYVVSQDTAVERKSIDDFLDTLTGDRNLFEQLSNLTNNYANSVLLLEGDLDGLFSRNIHKNAIYGALITSTLSFGVTIVPSRDEEETANLLSRMAITQQDDESSEFQAHGKKGGRTRDEDKEYIVSSIADVGPVTARALLREFGSVTDIVNADVESLIQTEGVGEKTAKKIRGILDEEYGDSQG